MAGHISTPESRFVHEIILGTLKGQAATMNRIAIDIQDQIRLKKTLERFRRHFQRIGFWKRLTTVYIQSVRTRFVRYTEEVCLKGKREICAGLVEERCYPIV